MAKHWRDRVFASTRGRVISQLRRGPKTVSELAESLDLTNNGVRLHLSALERDGLIEQEGVRRGFGKPAHVYRLTPDADTLFPKAYAATLTDVLTYLRDREGTDDLEAMLRLIGKRSGSKITSRSSDLRVRVEAASQILTELGGLTEVIDEGDAFLIQGYSCPLAAVVRDVPETCALAEELVTAIAGARAHECCDRGSSNPRCSFRVVKKARARRSRQS